MQLPKMKTSSQAFAHAKWISRVAYIAIAAMVLTSLESRVVLADESPSDVTERFIEHPDLPIIVRGDYFKAIKVAYDDFAKDLAGRAEESRSSHSGNRELALRTSRIENYDVHVEQTPSSYMVWFRPTMRDTTNIVFGGGATYVIDRRQFSITSKTKSK